MTAPVHGPILNFGSRLRRALAKAKLIVRNMVIVLFDTLFLYCRTTGHAENERRVVGVVKVDAIGDFVLGINAMRAIRQLYPNSDWRLILIGNELWTGLAEALDIFDDIIAIDRRRMRESLRYRFRLWQKLRCEVWDIAIQPTISRELVFGDSIVRMMQARERIGSIGDLSNISRLEKAVGDQWYTTLVPTGDSAPMELVSNAKFVEFLGAKIDGGKPQLSVQGRVTVFAENNGYYVLVPGASWAGKRWPINRFIEVARLLHVEFGWLGVVCGDHSEYPLGEEIRMRCSGIPIMNLAGRTHIKEMAAVLARAKIVVSNDTSAAHLSIAEGTPVVAILGGGHFGRFLPYRNEQGRDVAPKCRVVFEKMDCYGCNWDCRYVRGAGEAVPCISAITTERVWAEAIAILPTAFKVQ